MLFDIRGKRKRVIQVIYVGLALLMGIGLVGLGIGGGTNGGLFDALGIGGDGGNSNPQFDNQIERAETALATNPDDEKALLSLSRAHFLKAQTALGADEQGNQVLTDEALSEYDEAIDAWQQYLDTKPKKPDDSVAGLILQAYGFSISLDDVPSELEENVQGAYEAADVIATARPSFGTYLTLAQTAYFAGEDKAGAEAEKNALAEATDSTSKSTAKQQIASAKRQAKLIEARIKGTDAPAAQGSNPLEGLGGGAPLQGDEPLPGSEVPAPSGSGGGGDSDGDKKK